jgi:hypothetical protein
MLTPGVKRPGHEADHSPPSTAEVKNEGSDVSTPLYAVMVCSRTALPLQQLSASGYMALE